MAIGLALTALAIRVSRVKGKPPGHGRRLVDRGKRTAGATVVPSASAGAADASSAGHTEQQPARNDGERRPRADDPGAPQAPKPKRIDHAVKFGVVDGEDRGENAMNPPRELNDDLFWLRDDARANEEIMSHLRAENEYTEKHTGHLKALEKSVYDGIIAGIEEEDEEVHFPWGDAHEYFVRTKKGAAYPIVCRCPKGSKNAKEVEIVLDVNAVAKDMKYCSLGAFKPSPTHDVLAYAIDATGYETYEVRFKNLTDGEPMEDVLQGVAGGVSWGGGVNREVYYATMDDAHRPDKVWRHRMGTPQSTDVCVLDEPDGLFNVGFSRTSSGRYMMLESESTETNECYVIDLESESDEPEVKLVQKRSKNHRYYLEHRGDKFYILTNRDEKINFELVMTSVDALGQDNWTPVIDASGATVLGYDGKRTLESCFACKNHLIVDGREDGFSAIWVVEFDESGAVKDWHKTKWPSENALVYPSIAGETLRCVGMNQMWDTDRIFVSYSSLISPRTVYEYDMRTRKAEPLKTTPVKGFDPSKYTTLRLEITARDGVKVPVSVAYRTDKREHKGPLMLEGYGSYGISNDPAFMRTAVPLMERGVTIAVAHIRGGGEMGREWYEKQGKYLTKLNTFRDFIDVAEHLVSTGWTQPSKLAISGRSAGGLLMGATLNMRPDLFRCVIAGVPFVDVMVSMCDPSIPLTTGEWEEWGNPNEEKYYEYMMKYAPMENINASDKPDVLITAGLHDPRVAYWEAAKYATRVRESVTNGARVLLKTDLSAGHFSASDRYQHFKQTAFEHAFTLECLGLAGSVKPTWAK